MIPIKIDTQLEIYLSELEENLIKLSKITGISVKIKRQLLQSLINDKTIVIKSVDKGSAI